MYKKILAPIDNTECSSKALSSAANLAKEFNAQLEIFHVNRVPIMYWGNGLPCGVYPPQERFEQQGEMTMDLISSGVDLEGIEVEKKVTIGSPVLSILDEIKNEEIDLVVMGSHGWGPIGRTLLGSVSYEVYKSADCPVLIVK